MRIARGISITNTSKPISQTSISLFLDVYTGSSVAYSFRKLSSSYSGNCIRVRRSSDNTETNIGFVNNTLDTASLLSFVGSANGFVTTWYDQSGNNINATQTTAANQPLIVNTGVLNTLNSKPALKFDGTNDTLSNVLSYSSGIFNLYYAMQIVGAATGDGYKPDIAPIHTSGADLGSFHYINNFNKGASYPFYTNFGQYDNSGSYAYGDKYIYSLLVKPNFLATGYRNNVLENTCTQFGLIPATAVGFTISKQNNILRYSNTNFYEIIAFPIDNSLNRNNINNNINSYYGIY